MDSSSTLDNLDLGRISMFKHSINLINYTLLKDKYCRISPHQYEEVKKHLHEILEIGAI